MAAPVIDPELPLTIAVPLYVDSAGGIRVRDTRIALDLVIYAFNEGKTPEEIVVSYPALSLADVYAVISYYLTHQAQVDAYIESRDREVEALRQELTSTSEYQSWRERLQARWSARAQE